MDTILIIGIGNAFRGDDAVGLVVADMLQAARTRARVERHSGDGASLLEAWAGADTVFLVDAVVSGAPPGTVHLFDGSEPLPVAWFAASTHLFSVAQAVELARTLGRLPPTLLIYGIEGRCFTLGAPMDSEVEAAAQRVARDVARLIN